MFIARGRDKYETLVGVFEVKRPLGTYRRGWRDSVEVGHVKIEHWHVKRTELLARDPCDGP
jgi:hypothetical protein